MPRAICSAAPACGYMDSPMNALAHRTVMLSGPAGRIETILWSTPELANGARPPLATVACHPHPLFGGTMHNKVFIRPRKRFTGSGCLSLGLIFAVWD